MRVRTDAVVLTAYIVLGIALILAVAPFVFALSASLQHSIVLFKKSPFALPTDLTLQNYVTLFGKTSFPRWMLNSVIFASSVTVIKLFIDSMAGYVFAKKRFPGDRIIFALLLSTLMVPFVVTALPLYFLVQKMHLLDTLPGLILPMLARPIGIFMMTQFMTTIPSELIDAARIDGCGEFAIYSKIIIPIVKPGLAVLAVVTFLDMWINFLWPLLVANTDVIRPLTVGLSTFPGEYLLDWGLITAGALTSVLPIMIVFIFAQKYFIQGLTMGALKG